VAVLAPSDRGDLNRAARIVAAVSILGPAVAELLHPWILRFPAVGAVVAALEVLWTTYMRQRASGQAPAAPVPPPRPPDDTYLS
jgi:hypothetical protein